MEWTTQGGGGGGRWMHWQARLFIQEEEAGRRGGQNEQSYGWLCVCVWVTVETTKLCTCGNLISIKPLAGNCDHEDRKKCQIPARTCVCAVCA